MPAVLTFVRETTGALFPNSREAVAEHAIVWQQCQLLHNRAPQEVAHGLLTARQVHRAIF